MVGSPARKLHEEGADVGQKPTSPAGIPFCAHDRIRAFTDEFVWLRHGTTYRRAVSIQDRGPNIYFIEPGGLDNSLRGFSTTPEKGPFLNGSAEVYALLKDQLFPNEEGPAVLEVLVPIRVLARAMIDRSVGEIRFELRTGIEELCAGWDEFQKRICRVDKVPRAAEITAQTNA